MDRFARWLERNPVYKAERKRASRRPQDYESHLALMGLAYAIMMVAVTVAGLSAYGGMPLELPAINAAAQGWVLAVAFSVIFNSAEDQPKRMLEQMRLAGVSSQMIVWGKLFGLLLRNPRGVRRIPGTFAGILVFWGLVSLGLGQPLGATLTHLMWALMIPVGGLSLGLEGGLIGFLCGSRCSKPHRALLAAAAWITSLVVLPCLYLVATVPPWYHVPLWTWYPATATLHGASALIAYELAVRTN